MRLAYPRRLKSPPSTAKMASIAIATFNSGAAIRECPSAWKASGVLDVVVIVHVGEEEFGQEAV
jgi:hypothetical protein